jgi:hypothetical protein
MNWLSVVKPRRLPKGRLFSIPQGNGGGDTEEEHICLIARVAQTDSNLLWVFPL